MKRNNRYAARIKMLEATLDRHRAQARHDQAYIDDLESCLKKPVVVAIQKKMAARRRVV